MDSLIPFDDDLSDHLSTSEHLSQVSYTSSNTDPNNNDKDCDETVSPHVIKEDKYSLRPRSMRRITQQLQSSSSSSNSDKNNEPNSKQNKNKSHYNNGKGKQKPAPLSRYRRKTANARERNRMREINQAFETLRKVVPHMQATQVPGTNEKLTKITTLRLAMKYISTLNAALSGNFSTIDLPVSGASSPDNNYLDYLLLESDGESLPLSDHSLLASPDFPEPSLSPVDFGDSCLPSLLQTDFAEHSLDAGDFGDFLLT